MPTKKGAGKKATGSQKIKAARSGSKKGAATAGGSGPLATAVKALDRRGINHAILIRGIPIPDIIKGKLTVKNTSELNSALGTLLRLRNVEFKPIKLFPIGVPVITEIEAQIDGRLKR